MSTWHLWGDYIHTRPDRIASANLVPGQDERARKTAEASGFDFERRTRNGFEPWAAAYQSEQDDGLEFAFASDPIVRGWARI
jgi:hypothetical protein